MAGKIEGSDDPRSAIELVLRAMMRDETLRRLAIAMWWRAGELLDLDVEELKRHQRDRGAALERRRGAC